MADSTHDSWDGSFEDHAQPLFIGPKRNWAHWWKTRDEMRARGELPPLEVANG